MENQYVTIDGKTYRRGYTTGSCSAAAAKAAAYMVVTGQLLERISIATPKGIPLTLEVQSPSIEGNVATCLIRKDGGDDQDATHGICIGAVVTLMPQGGIVIDGGIGVGRVTQKGLGLSIGEAAINQTPRQMITKEVREVIGEARGAQVIIFVPEGEQVARKTFNPRLGIEGGISIIGTTGIVEPMSDEGWKQSLALELRMKRELGQKGIVLVGGNHGERFAKEVLGCKVDQIVHTSNFVGYMLAEAYHLGYEKILLVGHLGKLIKVAAGIFHTHSRVADARNEILIANLAMLQAPYSLLCEVAECVTTEAACDVIGAYGYEAVYDVLARKCQERSQIYLSSILQEDQQMAIEVVLFALDGRLLGQTKRGGEVRV